MQPKKNHDNEILIEVKKIGHRLEDFQTSTEGRFNTIDSNIEELAIATAQQFNEISEKFVVIDQRFDGIDQRLDGMDEKFVVIDQRFDKIDEKFVVIDQRFDKVDGSIEELAIATALEFNEIRKEMGEMATKTELRELKQEVIQAIGRVDTHLSATANQWHDDFEAVNDLLRQHDRRIRTLENLRHAA